MGLPNRTAIFHLLIAWLSIQTLVPLDRNNKCAQVIAAEDAPAANKSTSGALVPPHATCLSGQALSSLQMVPISPNSSTQSSAQKTQHSMIYTYKTSAGIKPARNQVPFKQICSGWINSYQHSDPPAFWVLDRQRGALVAKFIYSRPPEPLVSLDTEASLLSPVFPPIPAHHSNESSQLYRSCKIHLRAYITMPAHLDLTLYLVADPRSQVRRRSSESGAKSHHLLAATKVTESMMAKVRQLVDSGDERAAWQDIEATLPLATVFPDGLEQAGSHYRIQISAMPTNIRSLDNPHYLSGIAVANYSMTPECFGDPPPPPPSLAGSSWPSNMIMIISSISVVLLILIVITQYLLCTTYQHHHVVSSRSAAGWQQQTAGGWRQSDEPPLWLQVICCWCCPKLIMDCMFASKTSRTRGRVYAANGRQFGGADEATANGALADTARDHLRPLAGVFDTVELNENPNYLANGARLFPSIPDSIARPLEPYHIDRKRLTLTKPLGKGAFGEVYQGYLVCYCSGGEPILRRGQLESIQALQQHQQQTSSNSEGDEALEQLDSHSVKVAVKTLTDERMSQSDFIREAINMSLVSHRNIVDLIGVCFDERPLYIVMELLPGGNLKNFLLKNRDKGYCSTSQHANVQLASLQQPAGGSIWSLNQQPQVSQPETRVRLCMGDLLVFALDIARACDYLQKKQFIHRDLAARNCLLTLSHKQYSQPGGASPSAGTPNEPSSARSARASRSFLEGPPSALEVNANHKVDLDQVFLNGYLNSSIVAKLADFGMTRDVYTSDYYRTLHKEMPVRWMPPECLDGVATTKSDVWSYGVFLWELFSMGQQPYQNLLNNNQVIEFIRSRRYAKPKATGSFSRPIRAANKQQQARPQQEQQPGELANSQQPLLAISDENVALESNSGQVSDCDSLRLEADENEAADQPPLPLPHDNTPHPIYSIMCSCWASNPEERPQFEEIANRLYWCLQMPEVLQTSLPCFYEPHTPSSYANTQPQPPLNWWSP